MLLPRDFGGVTLIQTGYTLARMLLAIVFPEFRTVLCGNHTAAVINPTLDQGIARVNVILQPEAAVVPRKKYADVSFSSFRFNADYHGISGKVLKFILHLSIYHLDISYISLNSPLYQF